MSSHAHAPVVLHGSKDELIDSFLLYSQYREQVESVQPSALVNDYKAIRVLGLFLGIDPRVWPAAPTVIAHEDTKLPTPEDVHAMLHGEYFPDVKRSYANYLVRYALALDFGFGIRFPSEAYSLKVSDVDLEHGTIVISEPKKNMKRRRLVVEPRWLMDSKRHMSLALWLQVREKCNPQTDALFPDPSGNAFRSKDALRVWLERQVKPRFPWYYGYLGRIWSVNARLIEWRTEKGGFDYHRVARWHGHDSADMTRNQYEQSALLHETLYGNAWLKRAFEGLRTGKSREIGSAVRPPSEK